MTDRRVFNDADLTDPLRTEDDTDYVYVDGSYGDVAFPAVTLDADGFVLVDGTGAVAFGFAPSAAGFLLTDGAGAPAFGWSVTGNGTASGGSVPIVSGHGGRGIITHSQAPIRKPIVLPSYGEGGVAFGFAIAARGDTNDDDLALLLAA